MKHLKRTVHHLRTTKPGKTFSIIVLVLLLLISGFITYQTYQYVQRRSLLSSLENPRTVNLQDYEQDEILNEINSLYSLGKHEEAVIGKITNIEKLSKQHDFFKKAKNGDYLLVMPKFTLIYDRENKQVVDIARENLLNLKEMYK